MKNIKISVGMEVKISMIPTSFVKEVQGRVTEIELSKGKIISFNVKSDYVNHVFFERDIEAILNLEIKNKKCLTKN